MAFREDDQGLDSGEFYVELQEEIHNLINNCFADLLYMQDEDNIPNMNNFIDGLEFMHRDLILCVAYLLIEDDEIPFDINSARRSGKVEKRLETSKDNLVDPFDVAGILVSRFCQLVSKAMYELADADDAELVDRDRSDFAYLGELSSSLMAMLDDNATHLDHMVLLATYADYFHPVEARGEIYPPEPRLVELKIFGLMFTETFAQNNELADIENVLDTADASVSRRMGALTELLPDSITYLNDRLLDIGQYDDDLLTLEIEASVRDQMLPNRPCPERLVDIIKKTIILENVEFKGDYSDFLPLSPCFEFEMRPLEETERKVVEVNFINKPPVGKDVEDDHYWVDPPARELRHLYSEKGFIQNIGLN